jgi:hypothetical protein
MAEIFKNLLCSYELNILYAYTKSCSIIDHYNNKC